MKSASSWSKAFFDGEREITAGRLSARRLDRESDFARLARSIESRFAVGSLGLVIRLRIVPRKASSSARDLRIAGSVDMLMRIVRAFWAMA